MRVRRFNRTERWAHWTSAAGFIILLASGGLMLVTESPAIPGRRIANILLAVHLAGAALYILGPASSWLIGDRASWRRWARDAAEVRLSDVRWLFGQLAGIVRRGVSLPPQGRFNAGQRINIWAQLALKVGLLASGLVIWLEQGQLFWVYVHIGLTIAALPLLAGHVYLAVLHRDTRPGFSGMVSGWVDAEWARHHHRLWYDRLGPEAFDSAPAAAGTDRRPEDRDEE
jgi:formate dehydrogenase subunit gamma